MKQVKLVCDYPECHEPAAVPPHRSQIKIASLWDKTAVLHLDFVEEVDLCKQHLDAVLVEAVEKACLGLAPDLSRFAREIGVALREPDVYGGRNLPTDEQISRLDLALDELVLFAAAKNPEATRLAAAKVAAIGLLVAESKE